VDGRDGSGVEFERGISNEMGPAVAVSHARETGGVILSPLRGLMLLRGFRALEVEEFGM
jgi:hypothetical protein